MENKRRQFSISLKLQLIEKWCLVDKNYGKIAKILKTDHKTLRVWIINDSESESESKAN